MADRPLRVLVVDDEPLGRQRIEDLLHRENGVEVVGTRGDGVAAVDAIRSLQPDLVFLDVQMPRMNGLDVVRTVGVDHMPTTIFVTAHDNHALEAFELAAIDYLVKPFDDERFEQAFRRARRHALVDDSSDLRQRLLAMLQEAPTVDDSRVPTVNGAPYVERIAVESRGKVRFVQVADVDYIVADGPYAELHAGERRHVIRQSMQMLEQRLDPARFMRIHRSVIVRLDAIDMLHKGAGGDYEVQLRNGVRLRVSRSHREELEHRLGR
jgi:two-component system, LytTR family, response regulator